MVSDHNLLDTSTRRLVQNGDDTSSLPVDVRGDVVDDLVLWVRFLEGFDLPLEIGLLWGARDSGIADSVIVSLCSHNHFFRVLCHWPVSIEHPLDVTSPVEALVIATKVHNHDPARLCSAGHGGR